MSKSPQAPQVAAAASMLATAAAPQGVTFTPPQAGSDAEAAADIAAAAPQLAAMTLAEAAALVRRRTVLQAPGAQDRVTERAISPDEVLDFKDHGTHVVVVTVDGQKFSTADAA